MFIRDDGEKLLESIQVIETMLKVTCSYCKDKELSLDYYNLSSREKSMLSEERNDYLDMLSVTIDKIQGLRCDLEKYTNNCCWQITT